MKATAAAVGAWLLNGSLLGAQSANADDDYKNGVESRAAEDRGPEARGSR